MPKNMKRKRPAGSSAPKDFTKQKQKLGKKAKPSASHTVTDFRAKSIVLPEQSILQDKGAVVNKRNLSLQDLLSQCAHYNANVRKEAVLGIKDLFSLHPQILSSSLAQLFDKVFDLISDEDVYVRQAVRTLFEFLLPMIPARLMQPYMKLFVIYLINGMTNINLDIRLSALDLIKLVIVHLPEFLPTFYLELLPNFLDLLASVGFGARSSTLPKDTSKKTGFQKHLPILKSLYHLLKSVHAYKSAQASEQKSSSTSSAHSATAFVWDWAEYKKRWPQAHARFFMTKQFPESSDRQLPSPESASSPAQNSENEVLADFSTKIIPALLKRWLDMALVLDIIHILFILNDKAIKHKEAATATPSAVVLNSFLNDFRKYLMPHFPISEPINKSLEDKKSKESGNVRLTVSRLNSTLCAIMAHFVEPITIEEMEEQKEVANDPAPTPAAPVLPAFLQKRSDKVRDADDMMEVVAEEKRPDKWMTAVYRHVVKKLQDKETAGNKSMVQEVSLLLPVVQKLLLALPAPLQKQLMEAFHSFYLACHIMSQAKRKCIKWIVVLLTTPAQAHGGWSPDATMTQQWILSFPQILWKLQDKNPTTTQLILTTLVELLNRKHHNSEALQASLQSLKDHLVPFFFTQVSATKVRKASNLYGPFVLLPEEHQRLALQLLYYFDALPPKLLKALTACSRNVSLPVLRYLTEILYHAYVKGTLPLFELSSTVLSLLVANSTNRKYIEKSEDEEEVGEDEVVVVAQKDGRTKKNTRVEEKQPQTQTRGRGRGPPAKGNKQLDKETDKGKEVVVLDAEEDNEAGEEEDKDGESAEAQAEQARAERRQVAEIMVANVRLWGVSEALESMQSMLTLLLTTEAADKETKETLLFFLCLCARTRRASAGEETAGGSTPSSRTTGLPAGLAKEMPRVIFAYLSAERDAHSAKRYESVLDILASDLKSLSAYLSLLLEKLDGDRDEVLHQVLSLVLQPRLQPMLNDATVRSQMQSLATALLPATEILTPTQHKLQVEMHLLYGAF